MVAAEVLSSPTQSYITLLNFFFVEYNSTESSFERKFWDISLVYAPI